MNPRTRSDVLLLVAFCAFLFFYGLGSFGLIGADEPRYAQVAREMLSRHDWITPTLEGKPWLEKPALYYWQAMLANAVTGMIAGPRAVPGSFSGIADQAARLPSASDALLMIAAIYLFLRRFRPGSEIDGALITAGSAATIGFAHAAATDMPLTAMFVIALLGWYAWYETRRRTYLAGFYAFLALATLAKGPVAIVLAAVILLVFSAAKREWSILVATLWAPGIVLFLVLALPWYIAVQVHDPEFFRVFILEHNFARFSKDLYHHRQPFWFYLPVLLLAMMPWTLWLILAIIESAKSWLRPVQPDQRFAFATFLLIWLLVPVVFFSASQSKLPGYVLPSVPAGALLVTEYLRRRREHATGAGWGFAGLHAVVCGILLFAAFMCAAVVVNRHLAWGPGAYFATGVAAIVAVGVAAAVGSRNGFRLVRSATLIPIVLGVAAILRLAAPALDSQFSARPIARAIQSFSHGEAPVALYGGSRELEFGLGFYLNRDLARYESGQIPEGEHLLVSKANQQADVRRRLLGRRVSYLTSVPAQNLELYWVGPSKTASRGGQ